MMYAKLALRNVRRISQRLLDLCGYTGFVGWMILWILFSGKSLLQCDTSRTHPFRCTEENDADRGTIGGTFCSIFDVLC